MNYILNGKLFEIAGHNYYVYLHSDHVIVHLRLSNYPNKNIGYFQTKIIDEQILWNEMYSKDNLPLPEYIKSYCNKIFW